MNSKDLINKVKESAKSTAKEGVNSFNKASSMLKDGKGAAFNPGAAMNEAAGGGGEKKTSDSILDQTSKAKDLTKKALAPGTPLGKAAEAQKQIQKKIKEQAKKKISEAGKKAAGKIGSGAAKKGAKLAASTLRKILMAIGPYLLPILGFIAVLLVAYLLISYIASSLLFNPSTRQDEEAAEKDIAVGKDVSEEYNQAFFKKDELEADSARKEKADKENNSVDETMMRSLEEGGAEEYDVDAAERYDIKMQYVKIGKIFKGMMDAANANSSQKYDVRNSMTMRGDNPYYVDPIMGRTYNYYKGDFLNGKDIHGKRRSEYDCPWPTNPDYITGSEDLSAKIYTQIPRAIAGYSVSRLDAPPWEGYFWDIKGATFFESLNNNLFVYKDNVSGVEEALAGGSDLDSALLSSGARKKIKTKCTPRGATEPVEIEYYQFTLQGKVDEGSMDTLFDCFFASGRGTHYISTPIKGQYIKTIETRNDDFYNIVHPKPWSRNDEASVRYQVYKPQEGQYKRPDDLIGDQRDPNIKKKFSLKGFFRNIFKGSDDGEGAKKQYGFSRSDVPEEKFLYGKDPASVSFMGDRISIDGVGNIAEGYTMSENFDMSSVNGGSASGLNIAKLALDITQESNKYGLVGRYNQSKRYAWRPGKYGGPDLINSCRGADGDSAKCLIKFFDCSSFARYVWGAYRGISVGANTYDLQTAFKEKNSFGGRVQYFNLKQDPRLSVKEAAKRAMAIVEREAGPGDLVVNRSAGYGHVIVLINPSASGGETFAVDSNAHNNIVDNFDSWNCKNGPKKQHGMYARTKGSVLGSFSESVKKGNLFLMHWTGD